MFYDFCRISNSRKSTAKLRKQKETSKPYRYKSFIGLLISITITNALCHRLMDSPSGSVRISVFDDRVEIENTGHLPNELSIKTIKKPYHSYPQNPIVSSALYKIGFLESWGTGVDRMIDACKAVGLPEPDYGADSLFVWITFKRPKLDTNSDTVSLSDRQKEVVAYYIVARSSRKILEHIGVTYQYKNIVEFINSLVEAGYLERTIPDAPNSPKQKYIAKRNK